MQFKYSIVRLWKQKHRNTCTCLFAIRDEIQLFTSCESCKEVQMQVTISDVRETLQKPESYSDQNTVKPLLRAALK